MVTAVAIALVLAVPVSCATDVLSDVVVEVLFDKLAGVVIRFVRSI